ncbi:magnesium/cobalt transporter CorA [Marinibaculum pumilum]|uniref:Magnesium transport protein CorA n=1 Tax=Marinibaculum pumilum TaxID=1766165 RepID=A0ABV7KY46_9PROT
MSDKDRQAEPARSRHRAGFGQRPPVGAMPGTLMRDPDAQQTQVRIVCYGPDRIEEIPFQGPQSLPQLLDSWAVTWIAVSGLRDVELIAELGNVLGLHELALEDAVSSQQRPKVENYDDYTFVVTQAPRWNPVHDGDAADLEHVSEQIAIFFSRAFVLTVKAGEGGRFDAIRERLYKQRGRVRKAGPGHLVYAMLDIVIDEYFPVVEHLGEKLEALEADIMRNPDREVVVRIQQMRRSLLAMRRAIWPQREVVYALAREGMPHVGRKTRIYLRDCADHLTQLIEMTEMYRELTTGLLDIYLSSASARTNEVMRVLTIIATIFIPLGTVAGIYGMNFDPQVSPWNMPELSWYYGYPYAIGLMATMAGAMLFYFWRKGWLGGRDPARLLQDD